MLAFYRLLHMAGFGRAIRLKLCYFKKISCSCYIPSLKKALLNSLKYKFKEAFEKSKCRVS